MKTRKHNPTALAAIVSLGGFLLGFGGAVISGAIPFYKNALGITDNASMIGLSVSAIIAGSIIGNFFAGSLCNKFGRKKALIITSFIFMISSLASAFAQEPILFIASRIFMGVGVGFAILAAPMYIAEIAPSKKRGFLVSFNQLNIVLGISIAYFSNYFILQLVEDPTLNWRWMVGISFAPSVLYFFLLLFIPESPRWLTQKGKNDEALAILTGIGGEEHAKSELQNIQETSKKEANEEKASISELFSKKMRYVLFIGLALAFFQQISGINAIFYYAPMIFSLTGGGQDAAFAQAIILGVVNVVLTIVSMFLIDKWGRKPLLITGSLIITVCLAIAGFTFANARYNITENSVKEIITNFKNSEITTLASNIDPLNYKLDSIVYLDSATIGVYRAGSVTASFRTDAENIHAIEASAKVFESTLNQMIGTYNGERKFFGLFEQKLDESGASSQTISMIKANSTSLIREKTIEINSILVLIAIIGFLVGFAISLGPVTWTMLSEIFPNKYRGIGISIAGTFNAITSTVVSFVFPIELAYLGAAATFLIYAGFIFICFFIVLFYIPETKGKSLEQLEKELIK